MTRSTTLADPSALDDQTPLYNSTILRYYVSYLESHHVDVDIDELLRCGGLARLDIFDEEHFLTQQQFNDFHRCLNEALADPEISYKVGLYAPYMQSATIMPYGLQRSTPEGMYQAVDRLYQQWSRGHLCKTAITGKGRAETTVSLRPGVREARFQCQHRQGIFEAIGKLQTGREARVIHPKCIHRGDDVCHYRIFWKDKPSAIWKRAGAFVGMFSMVLAAASLYFLPVAAWTLLLLAMSVVGLACLLLASQRETGEWAELLQAQTLATGQLLDEIDVRRSQARLVQEIGLAGADILEVNAFLKTVLTSMSRNLDFTRGMIALLDDDRKRLRYVEGYGFKVEERRLLEKMQVDIDAADPTDEIVKALRTGRPVFLNHSMAMTALRLGQAEGLGIDWISVPLIHKKEPLGLLFVDTRGAKIEFNASDAQLLSGIAAQLATGIVNARSYARLQESEKRYRLVAENVTDVIWILDFETLKMKYVSPSVIHTQGYTPAEIMGLTLDRYLTPASFQKATDALNLALDGVAAGAIDPKSYSVTLELEEYHKDGTIIPIEVIAGFLMNENGLPNAVLGISRDLSERKKVEKERTEVEDRLQRAKKMESLGTMAGSIAHNFNNLLMVVLGNLEIAITDVPETSTVAINLQRAINASQRAADLSSMMLTYVGQLKKQSVPVDLSQTVHTVLARLDESKMANVDLDLDLADPMPLVAADADQMGQMITGFITNAIESLEKDEGRVRISTGSMYCDRHYLATTYLKEDLPEGRYAYVEVADTGCGMDAETLGKVFDPFFSTKFTGRGLGMAAVMGIIRSHHGAVKVSSTRHEGSVFTALLPIQGKSLQQVGPDPLPTEMDAAGTTVLLVDDEAMVMEIGAQFLKRLGYKVLTASSGQQALDRIKQSPVGIDCLLLDFSMPGMDGLETMQEIRKIRPDIRIIVTSGYTRQQIEDQFARVGPPDDFIHKPFRMKDLREKLDGVISKSDPQTDP